MINLREFTFKKKSCSHVFMSLKNILWKINDLKLTLMKS